MSAEKLLCVGGPYRGRLVGLVCGARTVRLTSPGPVRMVPDGPPITADRSERVTYTRRQICTERGVIRFLAPEGVGDHEALLELVWHYHPPGTSMRANRAERAQAVAVPAGVALRPAG